MPPRGRMRMIRFEESGLRQTFQANRFMQTVTRAPRHVDLRARSIA